MFSAPPLWVTSQPPPPPPTFKVAPRALPYYRYTHSSPCALIIATAFLLVHLPLNSTRSNGILNAAARLDIHAPRYCHITPLMRELHWLPVTKQRFILRFTYCIQSYSWHSACIHWKTSILQFLLNANTIWDPLVELCSQHLQLKPK